MTARTLPQLLEQATEHDPEHLAVVLPEPAGERGMSYRQLAADSAGLAAGLARLGLRRGDRILVWLPSLPEWFVTQFAAARLGLTAVAVNTRYCGSEIADILHASSAKAIVLAQGFLGIDFLSMAEEAGHGTRLEHVIDVAADSRALAGVPSPSRARPGDIAADMHCPALRRLVPERAQSGSFCVVRSPARTRPVLTCSPLLARSGNHPARGRPGGPLPSSPSPA